MSTGAAVVGSPLRSKLSQESATATPASTIARIGCALMEGTPLLAVEMAVRHTSTTGLTSCGSATPSKMRPTSASVMPKGMPPTVAYLV